MRAQDLRSSRLRFQEHVLRVERESASLGRVASCFGRRRAPGFLSEACPRSKAVEACCLFDAPEWARVERRMLSSSVSLPRA